MQTLPGENLEASPFTSWHASPIGTCTQIPKITWFPRSLSGKNFGSLFGDFLGGWKSSPKFWAQLSLYHLHSHPLYSSRLIARRSNLADLKHPGFFLDVGGCGTKEPHLFLWEKTPQRRIKKNICLQERGDRRITHRKQVNTIHLFREMIEILKFSDHPCVWIENSQENIPHFSLILTNPFVRRKLHEKAKRLLSSISAYEPPLRVEFGFLVVLFPHEFTRLVCGNIPKCFLGFLKNLQQ